MKFGCAELLEKSKDNMDVAIGLVANKKFNAAANRLYYSLFQVAKAYAVSKGKMSISEDKDVHRKICEIVTRLVEDEGRFEDIYEDALMLRKKADYTPSDVTGSELDITFRTKASDLRDELQRFAESA